MRYMLTFHRVPKRDWRDYFIMATVTSGLGYGAYLIAKVRDMLVTV